MTVARSTRISLVALVPVVLLSTTPGCASRGTGWGADITAPPPGERVRAAAVGALRAKETWVPVAAALLLTIDGADGRVSDWASTHTPVFGSRRGAARASDDLRLATGVMYVLTALATPSGSSFGEVVFNKASGLAVGVSAHALATGVVHGLKSETGRMRPNGADSRSFPSGHAASASVRATLAARNVDAIDMPEASRRIVRASLAAAAIACAWARVEARVHYPTDVLAGLALGHVFGAFVNDALLGSRDSHASFDASMGRDEASFRLELRFE